ncbi:MAG: hypothetical protein LBR17_08870 [Bacteroidales bacterium]|jgi:hypothetical protein|nr:hypothetical protein [Bacteroidales bacterium]
MGGVDYIPHAELEFKAFAVNFNAKVVDNGDVFGIPQLAKSILFTNLGNYLEYQLKIEGGEKDRANVAQRNLYHNILEADIRNIVNQYIRNNPAATPELLVEFGLNVPDTTKTPIHVPNTAPDLEIDFATHLRHFIIFGKYNSQGKITRGLPKGATGVEVWRKIGGNETPAYDEMTFLGEESKSPFMVEFSAEHFAQRVWYAVRYYNFKHEYSAWSAIKMALVN